MQLERAVAAAAEARAELDDERRTRAAAADAAVAATADASALRGRVSALEAAVADAREALDTERRAGAAAASHAAFDAAAELSGRISELEASGRALALCGARYRALGRVPPRARIGRYGILRQAAVADARAELDAERRASADFAAESAKQRARAHELETALAEAQVRALTQRGVRRCACFAAGRLQLTGGAMQRACRRRLLRRSATPTVRPLRRKRRGGRPRIARCGGAVALRACVGGCPLL